MIWSFSILKMVSHEYAMLNFIILKQANKQNPNNNDKNPNNHHQQQNNNKIKQT